MAVLRKLLCCASMFCALSLHSIQASAEPENGWWWNPSESGRGFFIEATGGVIYLAGYFYENDGRATWLSAGGANPDPYLFRGTLQSYRGGQTLFGAYRPPNPGVDVGAVEVRFSDDTHGTITWPGGTIPIERQVFGAADPEDEIPTELLALALSAPPFHPVTGWWWNQDESGRGFSIEVQGPNAFVVAFMYDDSGNPLWYLSAGAMTTPTHYDGDLLLFSGGQTLTGSYHPPGAPAVIGRMSIDFAAIDDATITMTDAASAKLLVSGAFSKRFTQRRQRPQLTRQIFGPDDQWPQWVGTATQRFHAVTDAGTTGTFTSDEVFEYTLNWVRVPLTRDQANIALARYTLASTSRVNWSLSTFDTSNGCHKAGADIFGGLEGSMTIFLNLSYALEVTVATADTDLLVEGCPDEPNGTVPAHVTGAGLKYDGTKKDRTVQGMSSVRLANRSTTPPKIVVFLPGLEPKLSILLDAKDSSLP